MSVTLNTQNVAIAKSPNFKGSIRDTEKGNKYYHSNAGLAIASGFAGLNAITALLSLSNYSTGKNLPAEAGKMFTSIGKSGVIVSLVGMAIHLGCGSIIDAMRNKEARQNADIGNDFITTHDGQKRPFVQLETGAKKGALLGVAAGVINQTVSHITNRTSTGRFSIPGIIFGIGVSSLGGWLLGKWSDSIANNKSNENLSAIQGLYR